MGLFEGSPSVRGLAQLKPSCGALIIAMNQQFLQNESRNMFQSVIQFHQTKSPDFKYLKQVPGRPMRRPSSSGRLSEPSEAKPKMAQNLPNHMPMSLSGSPAVTSPAVTTVTLSHVPASAIGKLHRGALSSQPQPKKEKRVRVCGSCNAVCEKHAKAVCEKCFKKYLMF